MTTMRAVGFTAPGGPEKLQMVTLPMPPLRPGDVRIRVEAAAVNPTDLLLRSGLHRLAGAYTETPVIPGMDVAGTVEAVGDDADVDVDVGDAVMAVVVPSGTHGGYAEFVCVPAASVVGRPVGMTAAEASTLPMNSLTVLQALSVLGLERNQWLGVTGGAGMVGGLALQIGKSYGFRTVADASGNDHDLVSRLGADIVVERGADVGLRMRDAVPEGVHGLIDGAVLGATVLPAVADAGKIAAVRDWLGRPPRVIEVRRVQVRESAEDRSKLDEVRRLADSGVITPRVADIVPAEDAADAHERFAGGGIRGRFVLDFA